ncbi:MAG: bifunctional phosphopantothenoylcysteine decarboxylase/phosphopantothenate--cysteine ligase CoaBC [Anaerosomatales bacterium]|nr:bifunctional phosphopantothenoylcysteine decarboxylase/phosphopantothenate--cysteine ligase CoaBC [Anaerosomatales bacterium]MDT8433298.1 bifunctional phosphopantothenoylcysteine decarboxylase/phosphopantothenate--cysteine ligase CoaBC [Anaerosomatales bacterium]
MTAERQKTVVLAVSGCIAAYKACEIARALVRADFRVKVVMTDAATRFVGPLTFRTLTGEPVVTSLWDDPTASRVFHVSLAEEADVFCVAPCTANVLAKLAHGAADDMLTTAALATEAPLVLAPAMNTHMWRDDATQGNVSVLRERGAIVVEPATGELACGDSGEGRLAELDAILTAVHAELHRVQDLAGIRLLVTAGPTYEPIDPVRYIGNRSSGKTGYAIAEEAARRGATVTLVSGPTVLPDPFGCSVVRVQTAEEMYRASMEAYAGADAVVASAAVSDLRPATESARKMGKSEAPDTLALERTTDILARMGESKGSRVLVGFAAESYDPIDGARAKLERKALDLVVANDITEPGLGFGSALNRVSFVTATGVEEMPVMPKRELACRICDRLVVLLRDRTRPADDTIEGTRT